MSGLDRHYCSTTYLLSKVSPSTLLHYHQKLQTWLPPGGHVEKNETPLEAAIREVVEETEINPASLEFIPNGDPPERIDDRARVLDLPHMLLEEEIEENHYHLDWIFYAKIDPEVYEISDNNDFKWFDELELRTEVNIFPNVRELALRGLSKFY